ncbi:MAG: hypothetical protein K8S00_11585 [Bacteroidales bacterium]|nr:hypothetical protein [Bacteroidales bacterium]
MESLFESNEYIDKYIYRDLSDSEIGKFNNIIKENPELALKVEIRELELTEKYLNGELERAFATKFEERIKSDKTFKENIAFSESIEHAAKEIKRRIELESELKSIKQKIEKEKQNGTYIPITAKRNNRSQILYYSVSIAALFVILLLIFNPFNDSSRINRYLAVAGETQQIEVKILPSFINGERSIDSADSYNIIGRQNISNIKDDRLVEKYFIKDNVLYTYIEDKVEVKAFQRINTEGQAEYFLCKGIVLYKYSIEKENKVLQFEHILDSTLKQYCN